MAAALALSGCAARLTFVDRTDGQQYQGTTGGTGSSEGKMTAQIDGAPYTGTWIYSAQGGGYSLGTAYGTAGATSISSIGTAVGVSAQGNGLMHMKADSGSFIRCVFTFNQFLDTGLGECQRNDGRQYDLRIKR